jgi:predicted phosphodiesterase
MRLAAISDIHGNIAALNAVLADIAARNVDLIVSLGDIKLVVRTHTFRGRHISC